MSYDKDPWDRAGHFVEVNTNILKGLTIALIVTVSALIVSLVVY